VNLLISFVAVFVLFVAGYYGSAAGLKPLFGMIIPGAAAAIFLVGIVCRVIAWARVPVPFRIPTTSGQQKSLPMFKQATFDNPATPLQTVVRMILEVLTFRSLLKNTKLQNRDDRMPVYTTEIFLWLGAIVFHYSFLIIVLRHIRLFTEPVPFFVTAIERVDSFFQVGVPLYYATSFLVILALGYLLARRVFSPQLRYISLANDYFPLFLLLGITISGFWLRYISKSDVIAIKELCVGLVHFNLAGVDMAAINPLFFAHIFLVSVLMAYFPFSKLVHMAGVFLSPTRNMANNNRAVRHINPWNYPVKTHPYEEYEEEFRELMKSVNLPLEKE